MLSLILESYCPYRNMTWKLVAYSTMKVLGLNVLIWKTTNSTPDKMGRYVKLIWSGSRGTYSNNMLKLNVTRWHYSQHSLRASLLGLYWHFRVLAIFHFLIISISITSKSYMMHFIWPTSSRNNWCSKRPIGLLKSKIH